MENKFKNFEKALNSLNEALSKPVTENRDISGIIKNFEFAYELSWTTLKAMLQREGHATSGARNVFQIAFQLGYIEHAEVFLAMIADRNLAVHTYNSELALQMLERIKKDYHNEFLVLEKKFRDYLKN